MVSMDLTDWLHDDPRALLEELAPWWRRLAERDLATALRSEGLDEDDVIALLAVARGEDE